MIAAAKAIDAPFAFHASLSSVASLAAAFAIFSRYFDRSSLLPAQEINGKPNYNLGPVKFAAAISVFWGIAGFAVGLLIASQLAWPALNFDLPWTSFGRLRPLHTSAVIFAFGGKADAAYAAKYLVGRRIQCFGGSRRYRRIRDPAYRRCGDVRFVAARYAERPARAPCGGWEAVMDVLVILVPLALGLGLVGLAGFLWSLKNGQYDDLDGAAWRAIADDEPSSRPAD